MFAVPPQPGEGDLVRLLRKPAGAERMELSGWRFIPEKRLWDFDDREAVADATGLAALTPSGWMHLPDLWFKAFAHAYVQRQDLNQALSDCAGIGADEDV
jgi:hypothetical protein